MLTKQDLNAIGNLIDEKLDVKLAPVHKDIKVIKKDVKKLRIDLDGAINFFNTEDLSTRSGLNKTRTELGLNEVIFAN